MISTSNWRGDLHHLVLLRFHPATGQESPRFIPGTSPVCLMEDTCSSLSILPHPLRVRNPEHILHRTRLPLLQVRQPLTHTSQSTGHDLIRMRLELALGNLAEDPAEVDEADLLLRAVHVAHHRPVGRLVRRRVLEARRREALHGQDVGDGRVVGEHGDDVGVRALLGHGVEGVADGLRRARRFERGLDALDQGVVAIAVVDDGVALGFVEEGLDVGDAVAGDGDDACWAVLNEWICESTMGSRLTDGCWTSGRA